MPTWTKPGSKGVYVEIPPDIIDKVKELASKNQRAFRDELVHALERHLEHPPTRTVTVIEKVDVPPLPSAAVETPQETEKPKRTRKKKDE